MSKTWHEWLKQADYDFKVAEVMFKNRQYVYVIFMCHLAIEKSFKSLVVAETEKFPPKTHDLIRLMNVGKIEIPSALLDFERWPGVIYHKLGRLFNASKKIPNC